MVEAADLVRVCELDDVAGPLDVRAARALLVGLHVVDGGEVEEVVDALVEALDAEAVLGQVADHRHDALLRAEPLGERVEAPARPLADERVNRARPVASEQLLGEVPADEAGRAGDEVIQALSSS